MRETRGRLAGMLPLMVLAGGMISGCGGSGGSGGASSSSGSPPSAPVGTLRLTSSALQSSESSGTATFSVARENGTRGAVSAVLQVSAASTAVATDYSFAPVTISFADGEGGSKAVTVTIVNDSAHESDETVVFDLVQPTGGATLGAPTTATLTIVDDDPATHKLGGVVNEYSGGGLVLQNNGGTELTISASGTFEFPAPVLEGSPYFVTIKTQPTSGKQRCVITGNSGVMGTADVTSIRVRCKPLQRLVMTRRAGGTQYDLYAVNEDGSDFVALAGSQLNEHFAGVDNSGRVLVIRKDSVTSDVYSVASDGTGLATIAATGDKESSASILPSGRVVFAREPQLNSRSLYVADLTGGNDLRLTATDGNYQYEDATESGQLVYSQGATLGSARRDIFAVNDDGSNLTPLAVTTDTEEFVDVTPAGRVLYTVPVNGLRHFHSVNIDGTSTAALSLSTAPGAFTYLGTLPGSERVLFFRELTSLRYTLFTVMSDGSGLVTLGSEGDFTLQHWVTSDGRIIYGQFASGSTTNLDIYVANADGTGVLPLATSSERESPLTTTPSGELLFMRGTGAQSDLYLIRLDGTQERKLTQTPDEYDDVTCPSSAVGARCITPNGRLIYTFWPAGGGMPSLRSIMLDGTHDVELAASTEFVKAVTSTGRVIYWRAGDLFSVNDDGTDNVPIGATADSEDFISML